MLTQLSLATLMVAVIVVIHVSGLAILLRSLRLHHLWFGRFRFLPLSMLVGATLGVIAVHTVEIWLYAALYSLLDAFPHFEEALYFSTVTYASIGYGDLLLPHQWRLVGAIEGAVGVIMLGLSTAFLVSLLTRLRLLSHDWLKPAE